MICLFLHGLHSAPGGAKPTYLANNGLVVINPALPDEDFPRSLAIARQSFSDSKPVAIVGSSRGGAVALGLLPADARLVLIAPAWKFYSVVPTPHPNTIIIHSPGDEVVPFADSVELIERMKLPRERLLAVGTEHRLNDPDSLETILKASKGLIQFG